MPEFIVTINRTETITFALWADSAEDAENRYLTDGDEIGSKTASITVASVEQAESTAYTAALMAAVTPLLASDWTTFRHGRGHLFRHAEGLFVTATVATDTGGMLLTLESSHLQQLMKHGLRR